MSARWSVAVLTAIALLLAGAGIMYLLLRPGARAGAPMDMSGMTGTGDRPDPGAAAAPPAAANAPLPDVVLTLSEEAVERAGIEVTPVSGADAGGAVRIPGVVEPNAYRQVVVTPLVAGRVTRVSAELGDRVRRGQTIAQVFSPELAEAQTRFLSMRADLEASEQRLQRTGRLVEIGAASRQELEQVQAEHTTRATAVEGARSQLVLLGMTPVAIGRLSSASEITATHDVPAPLDGVVTERQANLGLNVNTATTLFTVVDLSAVWVVGDLYEKDFSRVQVGSPATITTTAYPELALRGRVSYIDPQVNPDTRTARVRVEVGNPRRELRLGMFAEMQVGDSGGARGAMVPRSALQNVGDRHVVYVVNPKEPGRFVEREVRIGDTRGDQVEVLAGVHPGDVVVAEGSFFVRAERERLGVRHAPAPAGRRAAGAPDVQIARVTVSEQGYEPAKLSLRAGVATRITFVRTSDATCGTEVVFPSLGITRALPLNEPVDIEFTPQKAGEIAFRCGMSMLRGAVVVR